ncbi:SIS domain-containing protein [Pediococcus cellicola]|uniref:Sugar isomerase n=1 Tax=Pediococcus cellicola TaxID=319652 RepID=A0A0R2ISZ9_9LACO|nr:SIS domain-containing protein [Pediococcus cellicola]KRN65047.1 sugar isomerase [Pediococcus cellicola]GEL15866.1 SIS domain-containing protein [Pediococcus cellicola]
MKSIEDYVNLEAQFYEDVLTNKDQLFANCFNEINLNEIDNIVIYATGSSSNAAFSARPFMSKILKMPVYVEEPSIAANYGLYANKHTLYLAISQGGHSYSTIHMVKELESHEQKVFVLTSDLQSPIATTSKNVISMGMPVEEMPYVSAGYSVTILDLMLIALTISQKRQTITIGQVEACHQKIQEITLAIPDVIRKSTNWVNKVIDQYTEANRIWFIGYGAAYGVAREGETKITETVRITSLGKELEEYMHGPYLGLHETDRIIFVEPHGKLEHRADLLKQFLQEHVSHISTIFANDGSTKIDDLALKIDTDELLASLFLTIPVHLLAYRLSQRKKNDLEVSTYPDFDKITGSKI